MHLTNDQIQDILGVLAGILHLGNVSFVQAGGAQVVDKAGIYVYVFACVCMCLCACVCVCACVRVCMLVCVLVYMC